MLKQSISVFLSDSIKAFQIGQLLKQAVVWISTVLIAKSGFSLAEIDQIEWIFFLGFALTFFWLTSIIQVYLKSPNSDSQELTDSFSTFYTFTIVISFLIAIGVLLWGYFTHSVQYFIPSFYILTIGPSSWIHFVWYKRKSSKFQFLLSFLYFILHLLAVAYGAFIAQSINIILLGLAIVQTFWILLCLPYYRPSFSIKRFKTHFANAFKWLTGIAILGGLSVVIDGTLVNLFFTNPGEFAIYRYGARELPLAAILLTSLGQASIPAFSDQLIPALASFKNRLRQLMHIIFPIYAFILASSHIAFRWVYGINFNDAVILFDTTLLIVIIRFINTNSLLIAIHQEKKLFRISANEIIINLLLSLLLIPFLGLIGIIMGTMVAFVYEKIATVKLLQKNNISLNAYTPVNTLRFYSILLCCIFIFKQILLTIF